MTRATPILFLLLPWLALGQNAVAVAPATPAAANSRPVVPPAPGLLTVRRIYVAQLTGGAAADSLRELIIASINATRLFVLTDNPDRADAVLKGAADDRAFIDSFDSDKSVSDHANGGSYSSSSRTSKFGGFAGLSVDDRESHHTRERKHEAYASVRLCNSNGDVLWSTTQESLGGKFRGASADVAAKIGRQIATDYEALSKTSRP